MRKKLKHYILLISITSVLAEELDLPLCPTNIHYFPQNLPMHCRMPTNADPPKFPQGLPFPTMPPFPPFYQSPSPENQPSPIPFPVPPGMPGPIPLPQGIPGIPQGIPAPFPMPMMPLPAPGPAHKLPVIVMPFYSPDPSFKKPRNKYPQNMFPPHSEKKKKKGYFKRPFDNRDTESSSDTDLSSDASSDTSRDTSSEQGWWKDRKRVWRKNGRKFNKKHKSRRRHIKKKEILTPVLQYVTKDGYVIFEKKISKGEAKDWLNQHSNEDKVLDRELEDGDNEQANASVEDNVNRNLSKERKVELTTRSSIKKHRQHKVKMEKMRITQQMN